MRDRYQSPSSGFFPATHDSPVRQTVLLVDDDSSRGAFVETVLLNMGLAVLRAVDLGTALDVYRSDPELVVLVVLCLNMRRSPAEGIVHAIRQKNPTAKVVCYGDTNRGHSKGVLAIIPEPIDARNTSLVVTLALTMKSRPARESVTPRQHSVRPAA